MKGEVQEMTGLFLESRVGPIRQMKHLESFRFVLFHKARGHMVDHKYPAKIKPPLPPIIKSP